MFSFSVNLILDRAFERALKRANEIAYEKEKKQIGKVKYLKRMRNSKRIRK